MDDRIAASLAAAKYAPLRVEVRKVRTSAPRVRIETGSPEDEGAPVGPSEEEEANYYSQNSAVIPVPIEDEIDATLPTLEELSKRLSPKILIKMDEMFRAKFVRVRRVHEENLKP